MTSWDFWSAVSVAGIFQAILLLVFFQFNRKPHPTSNVFIIILLLWIVWLQLEFLVLRRSFLISSSFFFVSRHGAWLLLGPLIYHYLASRFGKLQNGFRMWLHYTPFLLFALIIPLMTNETVPQRVIGYGMLSVLKFPMLAAHWLNTVYGYLFIFQFFHAAVYLSFSVVLVVRFQREMRLTSSDSRQSTLGFLKGTVGAITFFTITSIAFIAILLKSQWYVREMDYLYIVPQTFCIYLFSYYALKQPTWAAAKNIENGSRYQQSRLEKEASRRYFERINDIILTKKLYLNPELRLSDLAQESGISYHQLSEIINREAGTSFFEFINDFRINHVVATMDGLGRQSKKINILEIAFASGFNNKVSFNRHFKKLKGKTPSSYIKEIPKKA